MLPLALQQSINLKYIIFDCNIFVLSLTEINMDMAPLNQLNNIATVHV